jgi:hypothetical protein
MDASLTYHEVMRRPGVRPLLVPLSLTTLLVILRCSAAVR